MADGGGALLPLQLGNLARIWTRNFASVDSGSSSGMLWDGTLPIATHCLDHRLV